tara:strand:+ start:12403 stop:12672 length:270 start_codon:yes stop_codon:yes gene_type:complete
MAKDAEMLQRILSAIGRIHDRIAAIDERLKIVEIEMLNDKRTSQAEAVLIRESLIEVRGVVEESTNATLRKHPVALPDPGAFNHRLEDF